MQKHGLSFHPIRKKLSTTNWRIRTAESIKITLEDLAISDDVTVDGISVGQPKNSQPIGRPFFIPAKNSYFWFLNQH